MCFDLNARSTATDAKRRMQPGKRHWINSALAQAFLDYLSEFPKHGARDACWLSLVTRVVGTGGRIGAQPSPLVACSAQFMWPANEGKQKELSNAGSRAQIHWKRSWASSIFFQLSTRMSPIVSYVIQHIPFQYTAPQNSGIVYLGSKLHVQSITAST
jgi:hypothetical protein